MLDGLLGRGFSSKCKALIKLTKTRIDVIRRKKDATQRIMKKDIADLLANGLDINAYGRSEECCAGLNILFCYDFIEQSCEYILTQLSVMQKQRECPEECREAVASLIFAAARFSDLPELRDLRDMFQERYNGTSLEYYVNQKFFESSVPKPPTMEKKLQLLQDIALEFSIKWDSRGFEQRMAAPTQIVQAQPGSYSPSLATIDKYKLPNGKNIVPQTGKPRIDTPDILSKDRIKGLDDYAMKSKGVEVQFVGKREYTGNGHETIPKRDVAFDGKREYAGNGHGTIPKRDIALVGEREYTGNRHEAIPERDVAFVGKREYASNRHETIPERDVAFVGKREYTGNRHETIPERDVAFAGKREYAGNGHETAPKRDIAADKHQLMNAKDDDTLKSRRHGNSSRGRKSEVTEDRYRLHNDGVVVPERVIRSSGVTEDRYMLHNDGVVVPERVIRSSGVPYNNNEVKELSHGNSTRKLPEREPEGQKFLPPPYLKSKDNAIPPPYVKLNDKRDKQASSGHDEEASLDPSTLPKVDRHGHKNDYPCEYNNVPLPKPRSVRRKHSRASSSSSSRHEDIHEDCCDPEDDGGLVKRSSNSSSRRREGGSRRGLQVLIDDDDHHHRRHRKDDEERMMDKLLMHYSKKPSMVEPQNIRVEPGNIRVKSKAGGSLHDRSTRDDECEPEEVVPATTARSVSLPHEQAEVKKVHARSNSLQPDNQARHVHPKLPDYDDLAARFAALRGR